jgi:hypothetical protein
MAFIERELFRDKKRNMTVYEMLPREFIRRES